LENIVILCFERHFSKQNSVIRLKSNILALPPNFWAGCATVPIFAALPCETDDVEEILRKINVKFVTFAAINQFQLLLFLAVQHFPLR